MAPTTTLLGPPELYKQPPSFHPAESAGSDGADPFINLMVSNFNDVQLPMVMYPDGRTEKDSPTFTSTGNPCLDFFFHVVPNSPTDSVERRLERAWDHDPLTAFKLVCNLRAVRGTGKSDKESFFKAALWLHGLHPKTLAINVGAIARFGCFKDLPEILYRILEGSDVRERQKEEWMSRKSEGGYKKRGRRNAPAWKPYAGKHNRRKDKTPATRELRIANSLERQAQEKEAARVLRKEKLVDMAKKAIASYAHDPDYKFLYDRISDHFAECLKSDVISLNSGEITKISLAAKWCPSLDSSFDKATLLCESIARRIFPKSLPEYQDIEEAHYAYRIRDRLRKEVLVPLRKALELPEVYIGAKQWGSIPYNRVSSVAMKMYKEKFLKHDEDRFAAYLKDVKQGKATIASGALQPHEVIRSMEDGDGGQVAELQWNRRLKKKATNKKKLMKSCLAVCDVSKSMAGDPMEACLALGALVSKSSEKPWNGRLITFSDSPQMHLVSGKNLRSNIKFVKHMKWGKGANLQKVFDFILHVAEEGKLKPEQMIKRLFVFSDMEFDKASYRDWETDYMIMREKFTDRGFGSAIPEIVFWNLRDSEATPVPNYQKGVALVSGFSKNLLKLFLEEGVELQPQAIMDAAISGSDYQKLIILD